MFGTYINYNDPFNEHWIGAFPTIKRIIEFLNKKYYTEIFIEITIKNYIDMSGVYVHQTSCGDKIVIQEISPRLVRENLDYYRSEEHERKMV